LRYFIIAVIALLVAAPGAIGGPDALSIAKRALRLADEPPRVVHAYAETPYLVEQEAGIAHYRATCPRGYVAISGYTEFGGQDIVLVRRRAFANRPASEVGHTSGQQAGLIAVCLKATYGGTVDGG
jgi:hypothetical protein